MVTAKTSNSTVFVNHKSDVCNAKKPKPCVMKIFIYILKCCKFEQASGMCVLFPPPPSTCSNSFFTFTLVINHS